MFNLIAHIHTEPFYVVGTAIAIAILTLKKIWRSPRFDTEY
jgi:hypothetical protein